MYGTSKLVLNTHISMQGIENRPLFHGHNNHYKLRNNIALAAFVFLTGLAALLGNYSSPLPVKSNTTGFLDHEERNWLNQLQEPLRIGITLVPNQVLNPGSGKYKGFAIDLFNKIEDKLGVKFEFVYFDTWSQLLDAAKNKKIDIVFFAQKTQSRLSYLDFTDTVLLQQNKIIINTKNKVNSSIEDISGWKVAVTKGSAIHEYLKNHYPDVTIVPVETERDALVLLARQSADAAISEAVRASYYIKTQNLTNLRIAGNLGYDYQLSIANRNDLPMLSVILSKVMSRILPEQIEELKLKWGYAKNEIFIFNQQTLIYFGIALGIILPFSIYLYFTNKHLQQEVLARKQVIEELRAANNEIHDLKLLAEKEARTDDLTQVDNQRRIKELMENQIEEYKRTQVAFSVALIDIDHFKKVNDKMGHDIGDKVLRQFAMNISKCLRPYDHFGRVGGEEFVIILSNTSIADGIDIANRIRSATERYTYHLDNYVFNVTLSAGIVEVTKADTSTSIIRRADKLLYQSKSDGRNRVSA